MIFNEHYKLIGQHAFLGASKYHWVRYDDEKLRTAFENYEASQRGTELHEFAATCIRLGQKLPRSSRTLNLYVNDAIGFRMKPEQVLYYSDNCFGTADSISFRDNMLRIHDLKTGNIPAHIEQLEIYAALFCLEYKQDPFKIQMELRIYQNDEIFYHNPDPEEIKNIMEKIIHFNSIINSMKLGE